MICIDSAALNGNWSSAVSNDSSDLFAEDTQYYLVVSMRAKEGHTLTGLTKNDVKLGTKTADALVPNVDGSVYCWAVFKLDQLTSDEPPTPTKYTITFDANGGSGTMEDAQTDANGEYTLTADAPASGKVFDKWVVESESITLADANSATTTFSMSTSAVSVKATYPCYLFYHEEHGRFVVIARQR